MNHRAELLSPQMNIAVEIYDLNVKHHPTHMRDLIAHLKDQISSASIRKYIDTLVDDGIIEAKWEQKDMKWIRSFFITETSKSSINKLRKLVKCHDLKYKILEYITQKGKAHMNELARELNDGERIEVFLVLHDLEETGVLVSNIELRTPDYGEPRTWIRYYRKKEV